jgi:hypothetical protein
MRDLARILAMQELNIVKKDVSLSVKRVSQDYYTSDFKYLLRFLYLTLLLMLAYSLFSLGNPLSY